MRVWRRLRSISALFLLASGLILAVGPMAEASATGVQTGDNVTCRGPVHWYDVTNGGHWVGAGPLTPGAVSDMYTAPVNWTICYDHTRGGWYMESQVVGVDWWGVIIGGYNTWNYGYANAGGPGPHEEIVIQCVLGSGDLLLFSVNDAPTIGDVGIGDNGNPYHQVGAQWGDTEYNDIYRINGEC